MNKDSPTYRMNGRIQNKEIGSIDSLKNILISFFFKKGKADRYKLHHS